MQAISIPQLGSVGNGLNRPECVMATSNGNIYTSDWRGGVCITSPEGEQTLVKARNPDFEIKPNGIALMADGSFLLAHLGNQSGGLFQLFRDGRCETLLRQLDGQTLPPSNYPHIDHKGRIWLTVSTRHQPRAKAYRRDIADGFIVLVDQGSARMVADNLGYANECSVHPNGEFLYVNETFGRRLSRFAIAGNGDLGERQTVVEFGHGIYPDGLTFDCEGGIWITSIISNRLIRIDPDGNQQVMLEDVDRSHLEQVEQAYLSDTMGRPHLDSVVSNRLRNISSLAFGGRDLKTGYLGCLLGDKVMTFDSPIAGWAPGHWRYP